MMEVILRLIQLVFLPAVIWFYNQVYSLTLAQRELAAEIRHISVIVQDLKNETVKKEVQLQIDSRQDHAIKMAASINNILEKNDEIRKESR